MTKRGFCVLLICLTVLFGTCVLNTALSESGGIRYHLPEGATVSIAGNEELSAPQGLESMYRLMNVPAGNGQVYLLRMPNGRVLCSVACTALSREYTPAELVEAWPEVARTMGKYCSKVASDPANASAVEKFGRTVMYIKTIVSLEDGLLLNAEGYSFCYGKDLVEIWTVMPQRSFQDPEQTVSELAADRKAAVECLDSLNFDNDIALEGNPYTESRGYFKTVLPEDAVYMDIMTSDEDRENLRRQLLEVHPDCGNILFDEMLGDVMEQSALVVFSSDMMACIEICAERIPDFEGVSTAQLLLLADPIRESLTEQYGKAECESSSSLLEVAGTEHALTSYLITSGDTDIKLDVIAAIQDTCLVREIDCYMFLEANAVPTAQSLELYLIILSSLEYTTPDL